MKFLYFRLPHTHNDAQIPLIRVHLINRQTKQMFPDYTSLVDSGASLCIFHAAIGEKIGLNIQSGRKGILKGVTVGTGVQFIHEISLVCGSHSFNTEVGFSYDLDMPWGLLGQQGFFDKFRVCFDKSKSEFEITPKQASAA